MNVAGQHNNVGADNWRHEIAKLNMQITQDMYLQKNPPPAGTKVSGYLTFSGINAKCYLMASIHSNTKCKNTKPIVDAMKLVDKMLVMAQNGVTEREDDSCMLIYGIIRDCGFRIRRTVEQEQFLDIEKIEHCRILH
jgi:hypothetical protein